MFAAYIAWLVPLAIGVLFGFAWGYTRSQAAAAPTADTSTPDRFALGYAKGWDDCRDNALRLAQAHDFAALERQIMQSRPNS